MSWKNIRTDDAGEFTVALQQDCGASPLRFRCVLLGYEDLEEATLIINASSPNIASKEYMKYREDVRLKGMGAFLPLQMEVPICEDCKTIKEEQFWNFCPKCGKRYKE